ncbi:hypothetical protein LCGC14_2302800 [marine sediment metagenome]|uniref:Uncharacterized protein n=1 Tax=marine sediment metagenome TaxID=412755 RepID=A0A0F9FHV4_9ZZZZ
MAAFNKAWEIRYLPGSGYFLMTPGGTKLCAIDGQHIILYDKRSKRQVPIDFQQLATAMLNLH